MVECARLPKRCEGRDGDGEPPASLNNNWPLSRPKSRTIVNLKYIPKTFGADGIDVPSNFV